MSTNTLKASDIQALPFFARFLEEQVAKQSDTAPINTLKYPSDFEG
ncbi:microviridin/marinostatin family tricyclic proteinase inhibitor [Nostoc sp. CHAB 5824]|nr:microviridin/marinostatin family tricyclic proteinase inhibitor [Nostoc sp. CHAB 5824]